VLAQTLFVCALLAIFAASAIAGIAGTARANASAAAKALIVPAVEAALAAYQRDVAATIAAQSGANAGALTAAPPRVPALNGQTAWNERRYLEAPDGSSPLRVAVDVVPAAQTTPVCGASDSGPDAAVQLQCSPFVQESRLALTFTSDAGLPDAAGTVSPLAHGRFTVTLRLFAQPPYTAVSGAADAAEPGSPHEGDTGGWAGALPAFASPGPDDTTVHVVFACTPGTGTCATSDPPPQDAPTTLPWDNGNSRPP
jgi:hypothetical protein